MPPRFRTFEPQPSRITRLGFWLWLAAAGVYGFANAWLPPAGGAAVGQLILVVGLMLAIAQALIAIGGFRLWLFGRAALIGVIGFVLLGPQGGAQVTGARLRLAVEEASLRQQIELYGLTGTPRCDCVITEADGAVLAGFRWHRARGLWTGVVFDPVDRLVREPAALGGALLARRSLKPGWAYVVVARAG